MSLNCTFNYRFVNRNQVVNKTNRNNIKIELQSFIVQDITWRRLHKCNWNTRTCFLFHQHHSLKNLLIALFLHSYQMSRSKYQYA